MALTLAIENLTQLPDGGPTSIQVTGRRGIDIGRDQHLDWTLPDPDRFISGKHCEIHYRDGGYWLHDVSSNGTFVNGSERRMSGPHRLRSGDRIEIGHYIIAVAVSGEETAPPDSRPLAAQVDPAALWDSDVAAPPIPPSDLRPRASAAERADFLDWVVDVPSLAPSEPAFQAAPKPVETAPARRIDVDWGSDSLDPAPFGQPVPVAQPRPPQPPPPQPLPSQPLPERPVPMATDVLGAVGAGGPRLAAGPFDGSLDQPQDAAGPRPTPASRPHNAAPPSPSVPLIADEAAEFLRRVARGAGVSEDVFGRRPAGEVAEELGQLMRLVAENLKQLLNARTQSRGMLRGSRQTMIQAFDNNPLKFSPTAEDALRIMFGARTKSYLDAGQALQQSFDDLKTHQINTFASMQQAVRMLAAELDPQAVEQAAGPEKGLGAVVGSRRARLWDAYVARWEAKAGSEENGLTQVFLQYFSECYERNANKIR
jgi:type VI secretion system protein ImpI